MASWSGQKWAGAAGLLFVVILVVSSFIVPPPPSADDSPAKFLDYLSDHRTLLLVQAIMGVIADIPGILFAAGLWNLLKRDEPEGDVFGTAAVLAFVALGAVVTICLAWTGGLAYLADGNGLDENSARTLSNLSAILALGIFSFMTASNAFSARRLLQSTATPRWVGWMGCAAAVLAAFGMFAVAKSGLFAPFGIGQFVPFLFFVAYVAVISVFMWRRAP